MKGEIEQAREGVIEEARKERERETEGKESVQSEQGTDRGYRRQDKCRREREREDIERR